jgi:hypothetical protein
MMTNLIQNFFGKKQEAKFPAPGSEGTLLALFLAAMPPETRSAQTNRYRNLLINFEFGLFVPIQDINRYVDESVQKGITPWANVDATSAFLYGAAYIEKEQFASIMMWLRSIAIPGEKKYAGIHNPGEPMQQIVVDM